MPTALRPYQIQNKIDDIDIEAADLRKNLLLAHGYNPQDALDRLRIDTLAAERRQWVKAYHDAEAEEDSQLEAEAHAHGVWEGSLR